LQLAQYAKGMHPARQTSFAIKVTVEVSGTKADVKGTKVYLLKDGKATNTWKITSNGTSANTDRVFAGLPAGTYQVKAFKNGYSFGSAVTVTVGPDACVTLSGTK